MVKNSGKFIVVFGISIAVISVIMLVLVGSSVLTNQYFLNYSLSIILFLSSILGGFSTVLFSNKKAVAKKQAYTSIISFLVALRILCGIETASEFSYLIIMAITIVLSLFLRMECTNQKINKLALILSIVNFPVLALLHYLNVFDYSKTAISTIVILLFEIGAYLYFCINKLSININKSILIEAIGVLVAMISIVIELALNLVNSSSEVEVISAIGLLVYLMCIFFSHGADLIDKAEKSSDYEIQLKETRNYLMMSQMKPHFIFNTLAAIRAMIISSPQTAYDMTTNFTKYLRANINTINSEEQIPFSKELEHIKAYVEIEKKRFNNRVFVEYKIEKDDFLIPPLTVEPLVENAIKHGICKRLKGGTVKISAFENDKNILITVEDDGVGFDTEMLKSQTKKDSVGLKNIEFRLREIAQAELLIESEPEKGSKVSILIRK